MAVTARTMRKVTGIQAFSLGDRRHARPFVRTFWIGVAVLFVFAALTSRPAWLESDLGAGVIAVAALTPAYLWCTGRVRGVPIYPVYALTFLWTYALPLASNHPGVVLYKPEAHLMAALTVGGFLLLSTGAWVRVSRHPMRPPASVRVLDGKAGEAFFFCVFFLSDLFTMASIGGWLDVDAGVFSLVRGVLLGLNSLAVFILAYQWGKGELSRNKTWLLIILLFVALLVNATSLLLVGSLSVLLLATVAYVLGRGRIPWVPIVVLLCCLITLHNGKGVMRSKYWGDIESQMVVQPWQYPALMAEWTSYSLESLVRIGEPDTAEAGSLFERASLVHLLLTAEERSPQDTPYLMGSTYAIIPQLLVPRLLMPDKPASHEGTYLLNIQYGLQTREDTVRTTIGWGLLNEAYANFGLLGCAVLAVLVGAAYGFVSRWSSDVPVLSARFLFAVLVLSVAFQTEYSASVYVTALFQAAMPLLAIAVIFMRRHRVEPEPIDVGK